MRFTQRQLNQAKLRVMRKIHRKNTLTFLFGLFLGVLLGLLVGTYLSVYLIRSYPDLSFSLFGYP